MIFSLLLSLVDAFPKFLNGEDCPTIYDGMRSLLEHAYRMGSNGVTSPYHVRALVYFVGFRIPEVEEKQAECRETLHFLNGLMECPESLTQLDAVKAQIVGWRVLSARLNTALFILRQINVECDRAQREMLGGVTLRELAA